MLLCTMLTIAARWCTDTDTDDDADAGGTASNVCINATSCTACRASAEVVESNLAPPGHAAVNNMQCQHAGETAVHVRLPNVTIPSWCICHVPRFQSSMCQKNYIAPSTWATSCQQSCACEPFRPCPCNHGRKRDHAAQSPHCWSGLCSTGNAASMCKQPSS